MDKRKENFDKEIQKFRENITKEFKQSILDKAKELLEKQKKRDEEDRRKKEEEARKRYEEELKQKQDSDWRVIKETREASQKSEDSFGFRSRPERPVKKIESIDTDNWRTAKEKIAVAAPQITQSPQVPVSNSQVQATKEGYYIHL